MVTMWETRLCGRLSYWPVVYNGDINDNETSPIVITNCRRSIWWLPASGAKRRLGLGFQQGFCEELLWSAGRNGQWRVAPDGLIDYAIVY